MYLTIVLNYSLFLLILNTCYLHNIIYIPNFFLLWGRIALSSSWIVPVRALSKEDLRAVPSFLFLTSTGGSTSPESSFSYIKWIHGTDRAADAAPSSKMRALVLEGIRSGWALIEKTRIIIEFRFVALADLASQHPLPWDEESLLDSLVPRWKG